MLTWMFRDEDNLQDRQIHWLYEMWLVWVSDVCQWLCPVGKDSETMIFLHSSIMEIHYVGIYMNGRKLSKTFMEVEFAALHALLSAYWVLPCKDTAFIWMRWGGFFKVKKRKCEHSQTEAIQSGASARPSETGDFVPILSRCFYNVMLHTEEADGTLRSRWTEMQYDAKQFMFTLMTVRALQTACFSENTSGSSASARSADVSAIGVRAMPTQWGVRLLTRGRGWTLMVDVNVQTRAVLWRWCCCNKFKGEMKTWAAFRKIKAKFFILFFLNFNKVKLWLAGVFIEWCKAHKP